jgi:hypothetical protein
MVAMQYYHLTGGAASVTVAGVDSFDAIGDLAIYALLKSTLLGALLLTGTTLVAQAQSASTSRPGKRRKRTRLGQSPAAARYGRNSTISCRPIMRRTGNTIPIRHTAWARKPTRHGQERRRMAPW